MNLSGVNKPGEAVDYPKKFLAKQTRRQGDGGAYLGGCISMWYVCVSVRSGGTCVCGGWWGRVCVSVCEGGSGMDTFLRMGRGAATREGQRGHFRISKLKQQ